MEVYDRGSAVIIEVSFKQDVAFGSPAYFDPTTPTITIIDPDGTNVVTDALLLRNTTGKWSYICQTLTSWKTGVYTSKVTAINGIYSDVTADTQSFRLV